MAEDTTSTEVEGIVNNCLWMLGIESADGNLQPWLNLHGWWMTAYNALETPSNLQTRDIL